MKINIKLGLLLLMVSINSLTAQTTSNLLFKSSFDDNVIIDKTVNWNHHLSGTDAVTNFTFPNDLPGNATAHFFNYVVGDKDNYFEYANAEIVNTTGYDGNPTNALYLEFIKDDPNFRSLSRSQYSMIGNSLSNDPVQRMNQGYIKYKMKMHLDHNDTVAWSLPVEWKDMEDDGFRMGLYTYASNTSSPYWVVKGQYMINGGLGENVWQFDNHTIPVIEDEWFDLEVYWYGHPDSTTGKLKVAINGQLLFDVTNQTKDPNQPNKMFYFMPFKVYGIIGHSWITDFEYRNIPPSSSILYEDLVNSSFAQPTATATYNSLGLYWKGIGGEGIDCTVEYKEISESTWKKAQDLWWDARPGTDLHGEEYRGSIVGLEAGTNYDIKCTLSTGETETITASTWEETEDLPILETIPINSQSSDFRITKGGSPAGYILYDGTGSTISGATNTGVIIDADYIILRGLTIKNVGQYGIELMSVHHVIIEDCDISVWGTQDIGGFQTEDDCGIWSNKCGLNNITIQNCAIHHPRYDTNHWKEYNAAVSGCEPGEDCHPEGANAIAFECQIDELIPTTGNYVIRNNRIYSDYQHMFNDGIGADNNFSYNGFPIRDTDIYGNEISHVWDDALEIEGGNMNVRVWENTLDSINIAFGLATTSIGPLYVFRNISRWGEAYPDKGNGWELFKLGTSNDRWNKGAMFLYHNTIRQPDNHGMGSGLWPTKATNTQSFVTSRNNILDVLYTSIRTDADKTMPNSSFDYDLCSHEVPLGAEMNGFLTASPSYEPASDILAEGSAGIDAGEILWNFNDANSAWPFKSNGPDIGAIESSNTSTNPPAPILPIRVNIGGPAYTSKTGEVFLQDQAFSGNNSWGYTSTGTIENRAVVDILNTEDDALYLTERWWNETEIGSYIFNIPDGSYTLILHFVEYNEVAAGAVVFDVKAEDKVLLNDFDIRSEVAQYTALVKKIEDVSAVDGKLKIDFVALSESLGSKIMAIEILEPTTSLDRDMDGMSDLLDNCIDIPNPNQINRDGDAFGYACDCDDNNPNDEMINMNDSPISVGTYKATTSISSSGFVSSQLNGLVTFQAGVEIVLKPGFVAEKSSNFHAIIENCKPPTSLQIPTENPAVNTFNDRRTTINQLVQLDISPNPFYHAATLNFEITKREFVSINLFDVNGEAIQSLLAPIQLEAGQHQRSIQLTDNYPSGIYCVIMTVGNEFIVKKIVLVN